MLQIEYAEEDWSIVGSMLEYREWFESYNSHLPQSQNKVAHFTSTPVVRSWYDLFFLKADLVELQSMKVGS